MRRDLEGNHRGFTLVELLVVIAIVGILIGITIPAVQSIRSAAQRTKCTNRVRQLSLATIQYSQVYDEFPSGYITANPYMTGMGRYSFLAAILPYIEQQALYDQFDFSLPSNDPLYDTIGSHQVETYLCPSDSSNRDKLKINPAFLAVSNYGGNHGTGFYKKTGIFGRQFGPSVRPTGVSDGASNTALISEFLVGNNTEDKQRALFKTTYLNGASNFDAFVEECKVLFESGTPKGIRSRGRLWFRSVVYSDGYDHIFTPKRGAFLNGGHTQIGAWSATSEHSGGVNVGYCDGHVQFVSESIDLAAWQAIGTCNGNDIVPGDD